MITVISVQIISSKIRPNKAKSVFSNLSKLETEKLRIIMHLFSSSCNIVHCKNKEYLNYYCVRISNKSSNLNLLKI